MESRLTWQEVVGIIVAIIYHIEVVIFYMMHPILLVIAVVSFCVFIIPTMLQC